MARALCGGLRPLQARLDGAGLAACASGRIALWEPPTRHPPALHCVRDPYG
jgi:hypothetical protein